MFILFFLNQQNAVALLYVACGSWVVCFLGKILIMFTLLYYIVINHRLTN